ncbi:SDR family NAD(P)-dependent oxidoreductase [uncultured Tateyamaria sp.]|uniref:SDR family NAD(P)-dependent oxidoreductase n=2 Tax=uncultured Tateyamaria sp. TaxID=455651 RepID=UPI0026337563|nr:SDR family NAD(P)-dependent oxidoreductase [uncultured Tateyamaria sp.]
MSAARSQTEIISDRKFTGKERAMARLQGKQALIIGGAQGIGAATAELFAAEGADVVVADLKLDGAQAVSDRIKALGRKSDAVQIDVSNSESVTNALAEAGKILSDLSIFVNTAGIIGSVPAMLDMEEAEYDTVTNVNAKGMWLAMRAQARHLTNAKRPGSIVNIASIMGIIGQPGMTAYGTSKASVVSLSYNAALELGPQGVRVNSVLPGNVKTDMMRQVVPTDFEAVLVEQNPMRQLADPVDIAEACLWLCSDASRMVNGASIVVDGGVSNAWFV